jgi:hypothetical protein
MGAPPGCRSTTWRARVRARKHRYLRFGRGTAGASTINSQLMTVLAWARPRHDLVLENLLLRH